MDASSVRDCRYSEFIHAKRANTHSVEDADPFRYQQFLPCTIARSTFPVHSQWYWWSEFAESFLVLIILCAVLVILFRPFRDR